MSNAARLGGLVACLCFGSGGGAAQVPTADPPPGMLLRVTAPALSRTPIMGTVVRLTDRELVLDAADSLGRGIARAAITRTEWKAGTHGHASIGLALGVLIGAPIGIRVDQADPETGEMGEYLEFAALGAAAFGAVGALLGSQLRAETWRDWAGLPPVQPGARMRVRIAARDRWLTGIVETIGGDSLRLRVTGGQPWTTELKLSGLKEVEVSHGPASGAGTGALCGAVLGAAAAGAVMVANGNLQPVDAGVLGQGVLAAGAGAVVGALLLRRGEDWGRLDRPRVALGADRPGSWTVALAWRR